MVNCLSDLVNRSAEFKCIIEVPTEDVRRLIEKIVEELGGSDFISVLK
jgi:hypothetical protein